jgi:hypothetical protein
MPKRMRCNSKCIYRDEEARPGRCSQYYCRLQSGILVWDGGKAAPLCSATDKQLARQWDDLMDELDARRIAEEEAARETLTR